jgi:hypothetical protein
MSGKSDVVDGGIVESYGARVLGSDDRQRHGSSRLPAFGFENLLHTLQDEGPSRTALACRPGLQLAVDLIGNVNGRAHEPVVPYLWRMGTQGANHRYTDRARQPLITPTGVAPIAERVVTCDGPLSKAPCHRARIALID